MLKRIRPVTALAKKSTINFESVGSRLEIPRILFPKNVIYSQILSLISNVV